MAYEQNHYQPPARPYNGRAAQRPGPPPQQNYNQPPPPQQYPPQQYDQYAQDDYGYDDYNNGYAQDGYQDAGRGNGGYPPQNQNYPPQQPPPQQDYYGGGRGGGPMPPRGGGRGEPPMQRPPPADGARGGYGGAPGPRGGYPNGGGRGGRPPMERGASDPSQKQGRRPLKTPPMSPDGPVATFDNPFPSFPGAQKKTSLSEEQKIIQKMANIEVGPPPQGRPRTAGSKGSRDRYPMGAPTDDYGRPSLDSQRRGPPVDDYGRPSMDASRRGPPVDDYGRPSMDSQRRPGPDDYGRHSADNQRRPPPGDYGRQSADNPRQPRAYPPQGPPQQGYPQPRRGPPPGAPGPGYGPPQQNGYGDPGYDDRGGYGPGPTSPVRDDFGPPGRSDTMPNEERIMNMGRQPPMPRTMDGPGPSAPYNGPVGRGIPPRPSTASGSRPPPQRQYPNEPPPIDPYANGHRRADSHGYATPRERNGSIDEFYDAYYDSPGGAQGGPQSNRPQSTESEMPNFDAAPIKHANHRRGASIEEHIQPPPQPLPSYGQQVKPIKSQPDIRSRAQPQAAVFEMAGEAPPLPPPMPHPNAYPERGIDDGYGQQGFSFTPGPAFVPYDDQSPENIHPPQDAFQQPYQPQPQQNGYQPPPRSASAAPRQPQGLPSGPRPGFPNGPSPNGGPPRSNTMPGQSAPNPDALPSHPPPVRAGLIPNSVASLASNKPTPVRNYGGIAPQPQQPPPQQTQSAPPQAGRPLSNAPVTLAELERLRNTVKATPNDQSSQLLLARKLVEASEVLVPTIPDARQRAKTREKYIIDAHKHLKKLAAAGNAEAMFYLADCHGRGALGLETDNKEAFSLYQSAAKAGHAAAAYRTAVCCELGNEEGGGTRKDPGKAIQWYKRAATLGDTPAMYKMGMILLKGLLGQPRNPREAVGWLKRAAERADAENPHALHELGLLYEAPQGDSSIVRDEGYSFRLFQQAADLGYKFSQFRLGCAYEYGLFQQPIDARQSIMWYSRAAAQEEHQSELALSGWYLTGSEGVLQQSDTEAYLWARKAAVAGLAKAEYAMGYFTEVGIGSPADLEDAKRWYWRAAAQNFPKARERLEDLKKGGSKASLKSRERISRSKVGKQNEGECSVM